MIVLNTNQIERVGKMLQHIPGAAPKAMSHAINRATQTTKTEAARKIREKYYIKHSDVISTISITKANPSNLAALVVSKGAPIALSKFRITPRHPQPKRKAPLVARVTRGGGGPIRGAFMARVGSGHVGVFNRVGSARLPIKERYGPAVPQTLANENVLQWVEEKTLEKLNERLVHEISRILEVK